MVELLQLSDGVWTLEGFPAVPESATQNNGWHLLSTEDGLFVAADDLATLVLSRALCEDEAPTHGCDQVCDEAGTLPPLFRNGATETKLLPSDGAAGDEFGVTVDTHGSDHRCQRPTMTQIQTHPMRAPCMFTSTNPMEIGAKRNFVHRIWLHHNILASILRPRPTDSLWAQTEMAQVDY